MKKISVGMLAYNEESGIEKSIESVLKQSIFNDQHSQAYSSELVIIPNGCTDNTSIVAKQAADSKPSGFSTNAHARVSDLPQGGKHLAWNFFIHEAGDQNSDYTILIDADVTLPHEHVFKNLIEALETDQNATVAAGVPVKNIELNHTMNPLQRISVGVSKLRRNAPGNICGMLYCARSHSLREFRLPTVLMGEDAFVRAMIVTKGFTAQDDPARVISVQGAEVLFDAYIRPSEVMRNKTRRMIELTINSFLYTLLWKEATQEIPATIRTHQWHDKDPLWSEKYIADEIAKRGKKVVPSSFITFQLRHLKHHALLKKIVLFPAALATVLVNGVAVHHANRMIHSKSMTTLWDKDTPQAVESSEASTNSNEQSTQPLTKQR